MAGNPANDPDDRSDPNDGRRTEFEELSERLDELPEQLDDHRRRFQELLREHQLLDPGERSETDAHPDSDIDLDELLEVLSNRRRRYFWRFLREQSGPVAISEASRHVAAWEEDVHPDELVYDDRKSVYTSLYQHHAPLLDDLGLIEFDKEDATARSLTAVEQEYIVETDIDETDMRLQFAGGMLIAVGLVSGFWTLGLGPFEAAGAGLLLVSIVIGVLVTSLVYVALITQSHRVRFMDVLSDVDAVE